MFLKCNISTDSISALIRHMVHHVAVSLVEIRSKVGTCVGSYLSVPSNRRWSLFRRQYDKAASRTASQPSTFVPTTPSDRSIRRSASLTQATQFQPPSSRCPMGTCRSSRASFSVSSTFASMIRTSIISTAFNEISLSSKRNSKPGPGDFGNSFAWNFVPSSSCGSLLSFFGPTNKAQWYLCKVFSLGSSSWF